MATKDVVLSPYKPRDHALDFHARSQRFAVLVWHRRAGKTVACINDLIDKALQNHLPMPRYGYVAPLYKQAKDVAWNYLKFYAEPVIEKIMESELTVILKNGALVRLYGADNPDAIRGVYFDGVILDEFGDMQPRLFGEVIAPTLADRKGWCVFIGTPKGPNHFFEVWQDSEQDKRWFRKMLVASKSGILDEEELEMLKNLPGSDEDTFNQEFECDFHAAIRGSYYGKMLNQIEINGQMGEFPWDPKYQVITAWDIGITDDTSIWFFQTNGREFKMIDFFSESGWSLDEVLEMLKEKSYDYGEFWLPHDAKNKSFQTGKSVRELMLQQRMPVRIVPSLSVQDGITAVRKTLPKVLFNTACEAVKLGLNALRIYQKEWDDRTKTFKKKPKHDWSSNPADAFRMFALAMNPAAVERSSSPLKTQGQVVSAKSNVLNLETLFRERENTKRSDRI